MSGHSKWATIKRKKAATDQKRGNLFTKLVKEITIAARMGGGDPSGNPRLRLAIDTARANSMPMENIQRAIKKGTGELDGASYDEITYEGYGPAGIALIIETATDNRNRTVADIRHIMSRNNGSLGESGSVSWMFQRKGSIDVPKNAIGEEALMELLLDAGLDDLDASDETYYTVLTDLRDLESAKKALDDASVAYENAKIDLVPENYIELEADDAEKVIRLIDALENNDDVQAVYSNMEISEKAMNSLNG
ncbi:MAG: YebC/PmpR family DNA-binding transcriptional regulator [Chlorobium sp.]|uniref:YebC/PmpR family DNA-binding transcriptional regulator n=1 Tax=Chlorobium sp. TaxID=1095 RepID=UPI001DB9D68D|nr:YebC/PmpR family DNA-binding transcriptional regulator [Chlorobium sp.]MBN1278718.1 YebC/PmpR family DNA-binding transcriptional regulator [Chlorobiaceae bacterium]MCF8216758.1 YebC/PmpR family DNA-binding transcriptional regulator [Chlorobium sp.]MCF8271626.1 YebC/PmpR family DNA-binding transcriptional regulator [Chlorobium sp.]MCF8287998.1 YebC/PmpR family DNA-binding transcriptional regulator [Chlorobium sp.]MCF8291543.1 YebC/PmpR family DNA-binding transcriptional regulator [Chlorobium